MVGDLSHLRARAGRAGNTPTSSKSTSFRLPPHHESMSEECISYLLHKRGLTWDCVEEAGIVQGGAGEYLGRTDEWIGRLIVPMYWDGTLCYCVGRTYNPRDRRPKYWTPPGIPKSIHIYRTFMGTVSWAVLVEGTMDALKISSAGYPAIALLGKTMTDAQRRKVVASVTEGIVVCLDNDAWSAALAASDKLLSYLEVKTVLIERGDPGEWTLPEVAENLDTLLT